jgi:hypothetical protein
MYVGEDYRKMRCGPLCAVVPTAWSGIFVVNRVSFGTYGLHEARLWENEAACGWVQHTASKGWADLEDFAEALRIARHLHAKHSPRP